MRHFSRVVGVALIAAVWILSSAVPARGEGKDTNPAKAPCCAHSLESQWGIEVTSLRLSAQGRMVDFRYKVLDPAKAGTLSDRESKPYLLDQASGKKLLVPKTPKVGPLRQTAQEPEAGKVYFALFANPGQVVKRGSKVTVVLGDFRAENLTVE